MLFYSLREILVIVIAAIILDLFIGDPKRIPHPVIGIGRMAAWLEKRLHPYNSVLSEPAYHSQRLRLKGVLFTFLITGAATLCTILIGFISDFIHPLLGYAFHIWFIATTIAVKGLKDAALCVYKRLAEGEVGQARSAVGQIVGRDTDTLDESEVTRATVETVAENTVDAFTAPVFFSLLGAAPFAMLYRAGNTLDSMVGYRNERYHDFGWASARFDDIMNWIPSRITGILLVAACFGRSLSARRAWRSIRSFAKLHASPNSGIPESAAAGALGVQLGGRNTYRGIVSERARLGWPLRPLYAYDIVRTTGLLSRVAYLILGGLLCVLLLTFVPVG